MSVIFTQHAVDRMTAHGAKRTDVDRLFAILDAAPSPGDLINSPFVTRLRMSGDIATYLVRAGSLRAVLLTGLDKNDMVVAAVYWPDDADFAGALVGPHEARVPVSAG